ncbi:GapA-binding peptide SR1P [Domibacillus robiginosus]|nr:GapA-binding peptide SR1P [Domibacillus robiginosus]
MGILICHTCHATIDHFESEKVTFLYTKCECQHCSQQDEEK